MKLGYQDVGSWTLFKSTPVERRKAAWLYAQFAVSKTKEMGYSGRQEDRRGGIHYEQPRGIQQKDTQNKKEYRKEEQEEMWEDFTDDGGTTRFYTIGLHGTACIVDLGGA